MIIYDTRPANRRQERRQGVDCEGVVRAATVLGLGPPRLEGSESGLSSRRKDLALLVYLHRRSPRTASRLELADLLWGDRDDGRGRQSLRQALLEIKRVVGGPLEADGELVRLLPGAVILDVEEFERDLGAGLGLQPRGRPVGRRFPCGPRRRLRRRPFAPLEAERENLRRRVARALDTLMSAAAAGGRKEAAVAWGERWVEVLPAERIRPPAARRGTDRV